MNKFCLIAILAFAVFAARSELLAPEVAELGPDDWHSKVGEGGFGGTFGGALLTSGSFTMMAASGGFEETLGGTKEGSAGGAAPPPPCPAGTVAGNFYGATRNTCGGPASHQCVTGGPNEWKTLASKDYCHGANHVSVLMQCQDKQGAKAGDAGHTRCLTKSSVTIGSTTYQLILGGTDGIQFSTSGQCVTKCGSLVPGPGGGLSMTNKFFTHLNQATYYPQDGTSLGTLKAAMGLNGAQAQATLNSIFNCPGSAPLTHAAGGTCSGGGGRRL